MICHYLNSENAAAGVAGEQNSRVTFSDLQQFSLLGYQADTYSIKYVLQGSEHYQVGHRRFILRPGRFLIINPQQPLDCFIQGKIYTQGFCIHLDPQRFQEVYAYTHFKTEALLDAPGILPMPMAFEALLYQDGESALGAQLRTMAACFDKGTATLPFEEEGLYQHLCELLLMQHHATPKSCEPLHILRSSTRQELLRRLEIARDLLHAVDMEAPDMASIAQQALLSVSHFYRSFRKVYGVSPYQYLQRRKLEKGANLLRQEGVMVQEVALSCGYPDLTSFSRAFKKAFGCSPAAHRLQMRPRPQ